MWKPSSTNQFIIKTIVRRHNLISTLKNSNKLKFKYLVLHEKFLVTSAATMNVDSPYLKTSKSELLQLFDAGIAAVFPNVLIENQVKFENNEFIIKGKSYPLTENVYLVGFGKAVAGMAIALERILGDRLKRGIVSVPPTSLCNDVPEGNEELKRLLEQKELQIQNLQMLMRSKIIEYKEGAKNNQPDDASLAATESIIEMVKDLGSNDTLIVLISGGGSALLFQPKPPLSSEVKRNLCKNLQNAGASITELNTVRKVLSNVKGGGLAKIAHPAKLLTLILSDVVGDPVDFIASGPTCPIVSENPREEAMEILKKYKLHKNLHKDVEDLLSPEVEKKEADFPVEDGKFNFVENIIIGNNTDALVAIEKAVKDLKCQLNLESAVMSNTIEGDVKDISYAYAKFTRSVCLALEQQFATAEDFINDVTEQDVTILKINHDKLQEIFKIILKCGNGNGILLLAGGEPTVVVEGCGIGGRNQELALRFSLDWLAQISTKPQLAKYFVQFLSIGTDGQDGPTEAAGAFGRPAIQAKMNKIRNDLFKQLPTTAECLKPDLKCKILEAEKWSLCRVLERNDSYSFFKRFEGGENLVKTGLTGTNVMDLHFIYIRKRDCSCNKESNDDFDCSCEYAENDFLFC